MLRNGLEPWHLLVVAIVIIMLFGSKKLPDMARSLGKSARILKSEAKAMKGDEGAQ
ncbi:Sec-independent protein translocase subunit TatA, partial [Streptomyces sp. NPDC057509]|uniref:Sec-independent protein translocase subunit TatA n=1 Tax=Streptomyces sp. NPDC057509 TaxID=3346152 RepID=UPI00368F80BD